MKLGIGTFHVEKLMKNKKANAENIMEIFNPVNFIEEYIEIGIRNFEIIWDINLLCNNKFAGKLLNRLVELKNKYKLTYSVHLPFRGVEFSYPNIQVGYAYADLMIKIIERLENIYPEVYVIHPFGELGKKFGKLGSGSFFIKYLSSFSTRVLEKILDDTKILPRRIAVENLKYPFDVLQNTIYELDLSVCMDAGHIVAGYSGECTIKDFLYKYFDRIAEIHLHDAYNRSTPGDVKIKDHMALGSGDLDYSWLINELNMLNYNKRIILEMEEEDAVISFNRLNIEFPNVFQ